MQRYGPPPAYPYLRIIGVNMTEMGYDFLTKKHVEEGAR